MEHEKRERKIFLQLLAVLVIVGVVTAIIFPIFAKAREGSHRSCASNLKQLSLGFQQYLQDYDDTFPLAAQPLDREKDVLSGWAVTHDTYGEAVLSAAAKNVDEKEKPFAVSPVFHYVKNKQIFQCPNAPRTPGTLSYLMNDLISTAPLRTVANPALTVLACDGEDFAGNAGHAYNPKAIAAPASYAPTGHVILGALLQSAPTRHGGGANYAFADGHVKWLKPAAVYFPSRFSNSRSHIDAKSGRVLGPNPASDKEMNAKGLAATFHLR